MALRDYEQFKGVTDWRADGFADNLQYGLVAWSRWSMLQVGGFENVTMAQASGLYGGHPAILRCAKDPNYTDGQVWEGIRSDWVWETGISYGVQPRGCSGVYVGGAFKATVSETGTYAHSVDYPRGRIIFDAAIPTTSDVRCDYAFRIPTIGDSKLPWFQELLYDSLSVHRSDFLVQGSGSHNQLGQSRRQMPTVGVELVNRRGYHPYQLGGGQFVYQDVVFHVCTEYQDERDKLLNLFANQNDRVIWIPNQSGMKTGGSYPLDVDVTGNVVANPTQYPDLILNYPYAKVRLINATTQAVQTINGWLYRGDVRMTCEAIFENI